jgi:cell division protein FtsB
MQIGKIKIQKRYIFSIILFIIWITFFDSNSFFNEYRYSKNIDKLKQEQEYYLKKIKTDSIRLQEFRSPDKLEKFARERYFMKKDNEDLYVIVEK